MYIALVYWTSSILRVKRLPQLLFGHLTGADPEIEEGRGAYI